MNYKVYIEIYRSNRWNFVKLIDNHKCKNILNYCNRKLMKKVFTTDVYKKIIEFVIGDVYSVSVTHKELLQLPVFIDHSLFNRLFKKKKIYQIEQLVEQVRDVIYEVSDVANSFSVNSNDVRLVIEYVVV